jgi:hypothetical protein
VHSLKPEKRLSGLPTYRENPMAEMLQVIQALGAVSATPGTTQHFAAT